MMQNFLIIEKFGELKNFASIFKIYWTFFCKYANIVKYLTIEIADVAEFDR